MKVKANEKDGLMHIVAPQKLSRNIMTCTLKERFNIRM